MRGAWTAVRGILVPVGRLERHVRVDQGRTAQAAAHQDGDVLADVKSNIAVAAPRCQPAVLT
jgi:hypothetical protein